MTASRGSRPNQKARREGTCTTNLIDNSLTFPDIPAGGTAESVDTFTLSYNRRIRFNPDTLIFHTSFDEVGGGVDADNDGFDAGIDCDDGNNNGKLLQCKAN